MRTLRRIAARRRAPALGAAALLVAACAAPRPPPPIPMSALPPGPPPAEFQAAGEVLWADIGQALPTRRAAFDGWRVVGPPVELVRQPDGRWTGTLRGREVAVLPAAGKLTGQGIDLSVVRQPDGGVLVSGAWMEATVRIEITPDRIRGGAGARSFDLTWLGPGMYNSYAGLLQLKGAAGQVVDPVLPQLVLALLAVLLA
jgi:hypothetical protein